jgi:preprotein translocase subunit SecA
MRNLFRLLFPNSTARTTEAKVRQINLRRSELQSASDQELRDIGRRSSDPLETIAVVAVVIARVLGLVLFDVQLQGAVAMAEGRIAEMQTG